MELPKNKIKKDTDKKHWARGNADQNFPKKEAEQ